MANSKCTFYIVRHGETEWNISGLLQGHRDSALTEQGIEQAKERAKDLKKISFAAAFSSDLSRAQRTAEIIAKEHNLTVKATQALRERSFGVHEGKKITQFQEDVKELLKAYDNAPREKKTSFRIPTTENDDEIISRFLLFLRETALAYPGKNVLVVSHGGIMRAILIHLGYCNYNSIFSGYTGSFLLESDRFDFEIIKTEGFKPISK